MKSKTKQKITSKRINQIAALLCKIQIDPQEFIFDSEEANLMLINEALTHTSKQYEYNHEKLEFLGDAVLRLAASEFIDQNFPNMKVGDRSALRSQLVSDQWLTKIGENINIEEILEIGPKASQDSSALATLQAEATEALIGAIYECCHDLNPIHRWLKPFWEKTSKEVLNDPHKQNSKSALQEWSQSKDLKLPIYKLREQSTKHGDPERFFCKVYIEKKLLGEGSGASRKEAEKQAATLALENIKNENNLSK